MDKSKRLYIAYGSNLNLADMGRRCPTAVLVGTAQLRDYELVFRCHATVEPIPGASVPVAVWEIQPQDEQRLDFYEGAPRYYYKKMVEIEMDDGVVSAMVYIMNDGHLPDFPSQGYLEVIAAGYNSLGLDKAALCKALERTRKLQAELDAPLCDTVFLSDSKEGSL